MSEFNVTEVLQEYLVATELDKKAHLGHTLSSYYYSNYEFDECRKYGYETLEIYKKLGEEKISVRLLWRIGNSFTIQGNHQKAKETFDLALSKSLNTSDYFLVAISYMNVGTYEHNTGNLFNATDNYIKALDTYELIATDDAAKLSEIEQGKVHIYKNIGLVYSVINRHEEALEWCKKAIRIKSPKEDPVSYFYVGSCYLNLKDQSLALGYIKKSLKYSEENQNFIYMNFCLLAIASIYVDKNQIEDALPLLYKAYECCEKYELYETLISTCKLLGEIFTIQKNYKQAEIYFNKSFEILEQVQNDEELRDFYQKYSVYCFETGKLDEAYNYLNKSYNLNKKLYDEELLRVTQFLTARFEAEKEKKELEIYRLKYVELVETQKTIELNNIKLMKINEEKDNILVMISHDLKNYIGTVLSAHDMLTRKDATLAENKFVKIMNDSSSKALSLLQDILLSNKMENEDKRMLLKKYEINGELDYLLENLRIMARRKNIEILNDYQHPNIFCNIDRDHFHRVIDNLCINAIKFTPIDGKITVRTRLIDEIAHIHIIDTGIGMDKNMLGRLFVPYTQASRKGTSGEESTGLGLYIVKTILEKHFATIDVFSEVGKGSEFVIKLRISRVKYGESLNV